MAVIDMVMHIYVGLDGVICMYEILYAMAACGADSCDSIADSGLSARTCR